MFVEPVALVPTPAYARIAPNVLVTVLSSMLDKSRVLPRALDAGFREMESRQPALSAFLADEIAKLPDPRVQGFAYFLAVLVFRAFESSFGVRLGRIQTRDMTHMLERLIVDGQLRSGGAAGASYSEDAIAIGQPALVGLLRSEVDRAISRDPQAPWEALDDFYQGLLVAVLVLTEAVGPRAVSD